VAGGNPRTVTVVAGQTSAAAFAVTCSSLSGSMAISASTDGEDLDDDGYEIVVDGGAPSAIGNNGSMTAGGLAPGDHTVELRDEAFNCSVAADNPRTVNVTAGMQTQVTFDVSCRYHLYGRIAFVSTRDGGEHLYSVTVDGPSTVRSLGILGRSPAVSPDGLRIAFYRGGDIWVADSDGGNQTRLTDNTGSQFPAWSPDGAQITYVFGGEIWRMDADGSNAYSLNALGWASSWSPDGTRIAFQSDRTSGHEIWVMSVDGTNQTMITTHGAWDGKPTWSPLGNYIGFQSDRDGGQHHIFLMAPDGSSVTNMTAALSNAAWNPTWAPAAVAGAYDTGTPNADIYFFVPGAASAVQLTTHTGDDFDPSWGGGN
jgi:TolB protein